MVGAGPPSNCQCYLCCASLRLPSCGSGQLVPRELPVTILFTRQGCSPLAPPVVSFDGRCRPRCLLQREIGSDAQHVDARVCIGAGQRWDAGQGQRMRQLHDVGVALQDDGQFCAQTPCFVE